MTTKRYALRTYGCQMNVHDSEKLATLLAESGLEPVAAEADADVLVINTCSIRDKAEHQLYSDLGKLRAWKADRPGRIVGVGGCVAQQVGDRLLGRFPQLDFVFGELGIGPLAEPRCMACGDRLSEVPKESVKGEAPPRSYQRCERFWRCAGCGKLFWRGTHWARIERELDRQRGNMRGTGANGSPSRPTARSSTPACWSRPTRS